MKRSIVTEEELRQELRKKVNTYGSGKVARMLGMPHCTVINVCKGRSGIGEVTAKALGFEMVYRKVRDSAVVVAMLAAIP